MRATTTKILQNSVYKQECSMIFTGSGRVGRRVALSVCMCVCDIASPVTLNLSHVTYHMQCVAWFFSIIFCFFIKISISILKNWTKWLSLLVEGLLSMWPNLSSFLRVSVPAMDDFLALFVTPNDWPNVF